MHKHGYAALAMPKKMRADINKTYLTQYIATAMTKKNRVPSSSPPSTFRRASTAAASLLPSQALRVGTMV